MANGDGDHKEIWDAINQLRTTTTRMEANLANIATPREFSDLRVETGALNATLKALDVEALKEEAIKTVAESVATKTDVDWLKRHFWQAVAILGGIQSATVIVLISHVLKP